MKAYKGFNADMTCRGFQYKEGETYHEDIADYVIKASTYVLVDGDFVEVSE